MADTIRTNADLLNNIFRNNQPAGSISAQDVRDLIVSTPFLQPLRWTFLFDGQYTSIATRSILAGVRTQITIDGVRENSIFPPGPAVWNTTTNKLDPQLEDGFGIIRMALTAFSTSTNNNVFDFEMDVSADGTSNTIFAETSVFAKGFGAANVQFFNYNIPAFIGPEFSVNGARFFITPLADIDAYDFAVTAARIFAPNPAGL